MCGENQLTPPAEEDGAQRSAQRQEKRKGGEKGREVMIKKGPKPRGGTPVS